MSRPRGSIIGAKPTWTTTATSGIWTLRQAEEMNADEKWPRGPVAPAGLAGTGGNAEVALTWTAPATTHGTITNYAVEYAPSGGAATVVLTGSTAASYTVTGLTNGTEYTFRVAAVNGVGQGAWSSTASATPQNAPSSIVVSGGSGDFAPLRLTYALDGTQNGRVRYTSTTNAGWIGDGAPARILWSGSQWEIKSANAAWPAVYASSAVDSAAPPTTGWSDTWNGTPTLTYA
jgi:hypothetical protein